MRVAHVRNLALVVLLGAFFIPLVVTPPAKGAAPMRLSSLSSATGRLAFVTTSGGDDFIDVMNANGTHVQQLTNCGPGECYPSWSPDGREIVFQAEFDGVGIYVMNANGSHVRRLSPIPAADVRPSWSASGKEIVFSRVVGTATNGGVPPTEIDVMDANGSNVRTILPADGTFNIEPRWSPTGDTIVFMSGRSHSQQIYTMRANGTDLRMITHQGANGDPAWSPNGQRISFGSDRQGDGRLNIFTMSPAGAHVQQVTHFAPPFEAGDTNWSSDGTTLVFELDRGGDGQSNPNVPASVWTIRANGTDAMSTHHSCAAVGCSPRFQPVP